MKLESLKMNLKSLKSQVNNQKGQSIKGKSTKIAAAFMQNKANFVNNKISVNSFETSKYEILAALWSKKQTQFKPNTNPIHKRPKMNANPFNKMIYKNFMPLAKQKTKPIQTQIFTPDVSLLALLSGDKSNTSLSSKIVVEGPILSIPKFGNGNFLRLKAIYPILYANLSNMCNQLDYLKCIEGGNYEFRKMSLKVQL